MAYAEYYKIDIPSDPSAQYFVMEKGGNKINPTLTIGRLGSSGTSYAKRIFDCNNETVKYLGTGDSLDAMEKSKPDPKMAPIVTGSIAYYQWQYACGK